MRLCRINFPHLSLQQSCFSIGAAEATTVRLWSRPLSRPGPRGRFEKDIDIFAAKSNSGSIHSIRSVHQHSETRASAGTSTIYALSTPPGRAAIAIVRVSGSACREIYQNLCPNKPLPRPRYAAVRALSHPSRRDEVDSVLDSNALVLFFPAPQTVTGEDVLELHLHGGPAVVKAVLGAIGSCNTASNQIRYAEPGEFTRRAFMNDRIDLTQVEALGNTLSAVTEEQRKLAVHGASNRLAQRYESWRYMLLQARGELEALIDFSEDQHFDESSTTLISSVALQIRALAKHIALHKTNAVRGELLRGGIAISLIGSPNVGKSSLLNQIVGRNAAIVSQEAGTTRDIVEVGVDIGGFFCRFGDTAGIRHSQSPEDALANTIGEIEKEGIKRAKQKAMDSDLVVVVLSIEPAPDWQGYQLQLPPEVLDTVRQLMQSDKTLVIAVNKIDLYGQDAATMEANLIPSVQSFLPDVPQDRIFCISCREAESVTPSAENIDPGKLRCFVDGLVQTFRDMTKALEPEDTSSEPALVRGESGVPIQEDTSVWADSLGASERQRALLESCLTHLEVFLNQAELADSPAPSIAADDDEDFEGSVDIVLAAESLRSAADCIAKVTGRGEAGDVEEVLGVVFEKFCVGK